MAKKPTLKPTKRTLIQRDYCSRCESDAHVVKNGLRNGKQRYKCQYCGNTFYEYGLVDSRTMMARQVIIMTLLGKSKDVIAKKLNIGEKTVARHLNKYTHMPEFQKIIPQLYERVDGKHRSEEIEIPIYQSWTDTPEKSIPYNLFARTDPRKKTVKISKIKENKDRFMNLLLLGDEQENNIKKYLYSGDLFVLYDGSGLRGACVVTRFNRSRCELKNIAVLPKYRGQRYGSALVKYVINHYQGKYKDIIVGTGDSPKHLAFYKLWRFKRSHVVKNYFVDNYVHPILEDGKQMVDMIYLIRELNGND